MGKLNAGLAAFLANKRAGQQPTTIGVQSNNPMVAMSPSMLSTIKASPKGKLPPGLARYMAAKNKGKGKPLKAKGKIVKANKSQAKIDKLEKKLGVVQA